MADLTLTTALLPDEVEWRVQSVTKTGKTVVVPYIQNRAVQQRLDSLYGPMGWRNEYKEWRTKGVICGISIYNDLIEQWVTKWDGADETNIEPTKGGLSDSMKRCAVQWGMGRELYKYPRVFVEGEHKFIPHWAQTRLAALVKAHNEGKLDRDMYTIKNEQK